MAATILKPKKRRIRAPIKPMWMRAKARWYLARGVPLRWVAKALGVMPNTVVAWTRDAKPSETQMLYNRVRRQIMMLPAFERRKLWLKLTKEFNQ